MSSLSRIAQLKKLNEGNFVRSEYSQENREFVMWFENDNINIPEGCCREFGRVYDLEDEIKICRVLIGSK